MQTSRPLLLIDGYNAILRRGRVAPDNDYALEQARDHLLAELAAYRGSKQIRILVVFDGRNQSGYRPPQNLSGISCRFSHPPKSADDVILKTIGQAKNPQNITLVTSDRRLAALARAHQAGHLTVEEFFDRMSRHRQPKRMAEKPKPTLSRAELDQWLELFDKRDKEEPEP